MSKKYNVCGVLVHVNEEKFSGLMEYLNQLPGCEVVEHDHKNKIALVIEDQENEDAYAIMETVKAHPSVLSISLINHFFDEVYGENGNEIQS